MNPTNPNSDNMQNVPTLRFPEFDSEYKIESLGVIARFSKGKGISKSDVSEGGQTDCIRYGELYTTYGELINETVSKTNLPVNELTISEEDDLIIPASGETAIDIATASCVKRKGIALGGDINIIKCNEDSTFLAYYLNGKKRNDVARYAQGSSVIHLYSTQLKLLKLKLPTIPEQQKIASFLSAVDSKIEQLTRKKELLEQYKKGVMQKLFPPSTGSGGKVQHPELRFKDENGEDFPDWEVKKLKKVVTVNPKTGELPSKFIYIDLESVEKGKLLKQEWVTREEAPSRAQRLLENGDILFQTVRPYQMNNYLFEIEGDYVASTGYAQLKPKSNKLFIFYYLHLQSIVNLIVRWSTGTSFPAIGAKDLANVNLSIPSRNEQKKIGTFIDSISKKIYDLDNEIEKSKTFKKGLLQQMFV